MKVNILFFIILASFFFIFGMPRAAHAYLDPGTGGYFIQIILASLVGVAFGAKSYLGRIKIYFSRLFAKITKK